MVNFKLFRIIEFEIERRLLFKEGEREVLRCCSYHYIEPTKIP
jgi:hypothetical protein